MTQTLDRTETQTPQSLPQARVDPQKASTTRAGDRGRLGTAHLLPDPVGRIQSRHSR